MALLVPTRVTPTATTVTGAAAGTSNTVSATDIGTRGALLVINNGGGAPITVTLEDPTSTGVGNPGVETAHSVAAAGERWFRLNRKHVDPATNVATVTLSAATSVTYKLVPC